jgi:hypothetical protein
MQPGSLQKRVPGAHILMEKPGKLMKTGLAHLNKVPKNPAKIPCKHGFLFFPENPPGHFYRSREE